MTCLDMEERLAEFLAGELAERSEVEEHLLACADCRAKFSLAKAGWEAAGEWNVAGPSGDAVAATLESIRTVHPYRALVRLLQAGTIAASLVIAWAVGTSKPESRVLESTPAVAGPKATGLASLQPSVGLLFVRDESGRPAGELSIRRLSVRVDIRDGIARTEIEEVFENRTDLRLEGTFRFPLPPDASISRLAMEIEGKLREGEVVEREKARQTYEGIVRKMKDPALLEWMPGGIFQCRIFPIEPRSDKRIIIAYTQALSVFDGGGRYVYPLAGESMRDLGIGRFELAAIIRSGAKLAKAESTSHTAATIRLDDRTMRTTFAASDFRPNADFVLAFETASPDEIQVSAHRPEGTGSGYFAAFLTPRVEGEEIRRDRTIHFLLDTSGSVSMAELEAARVVVRRMIGALHPGERFRIGCHNLIIGLMPESAASDEKGKRAAERYLAELVREGASDVAGAMEAALSFVPEGGELVYIGEGTPTWGENDPAKILARIRQAIGTRKITIRTVAVGSDAEKGLLESIAREFNGGAHAISPSDDVASRADEIARTLGRPAITNLKAQFEGAVTDTAPGTLGMIHVGERILVTGRYGAGLAKLILTGRVPGRDLRREFALTLPDHEADNLHVKRLWAQRRLADLVAQGDARRADAVKLSVEHQVMTPYTSFLVLENEKAYEDHRIERTKKDADQTKDPGQRTTAKADPVEQRAREEVRRKLDQRRELELLFTQAQVHFERGQYDRCIDVCDRILSIDPRLSSVEEMKMIAQRLGHVKEDRDLTRSYIEQWKRTFENVDRVVNVDELSFPARELWMETIRQRRPKGILGSEEDVNPAFSTLPGGQYATFIDPDGGGGPLAGASFTLIEPKADPAAQEIDKFAVGVETLSRQLESRLDQITAWENEGKPSDLRVDGYYSEDAISRPPVGGYDIGGTGFTDIDGVLEEKLKLISELESRVAQERQDRSGSSNRSMTAMQDLQYQRQELERLVRKQSPVIKQTRSLQPSGVVAGDLRQVEARLEAKMDELKAAERLGRDLGRLEADYQELARERQRLQETIAHLNSSAAGTSAVMPRRALSGQVTAVALELDLVVISIGRDAGVNEGDEFTIYRGATFTGKLTIDRVDRAWSSGRVTLKGREEPRIGDQATNQVLATPGQAPPTTVQQPPPLAAKADDEVILSGMDQKRARVGGLIVVMRKESYVATVQALEVQHHTVRARILPRLRAGTVSTGDQAFPVDSSADLWKLLPESIRREIISERDLAAARLKLRLLRGATGGGK